MQELLPPDLVLPALDFTSLGELLLVIILASSRMTVILTFSPIFTELALPPSIRVAAALALSAPVWPTVELGSGDGGLELWTVFLLSAKEMMIGLFLLLITGLPFWAADMAGDVVEIQRGMGNEAVTDPSDLVQSQPIGRLFFLMFLLFVIASNGLSIIMDVIYSSYDALPIDQIPDLGALAGGLLGTGLFEALFDYALLILLPALLLLLLTDTAIALLARFAPQLNVLQLSLIGKGLVLVLFLPLYGPALFSLVEPLLIDVMARYQAFEP